MEAHDGPVHVNPGVSTPVPVLLMVRELNVGGTERQCAEMARALDRSRYAAHVACFRPSGFRAKELREEGIPVVDLGVHSFASKSALRGARLLRDYLRRHRIRLVHTFDIPLNLYGATIAWALRVPIVLTSQRQSPALDPRGFPRVRWAHRLADGIVVNCDAVRKEMMEREGWPASKIFLCRNGLDTSAFPARDASGDSGALTIGVVCVLRPEKDLLTLVNAFDRVRVMKPGLRLLLAGDGPLRASIETRIKELGMTDQCTLAGSVADVAACFQAMDIFVLPSLSEALSNSLMEAMASGCACVASRVGGNPELIEEERTGLLFDPGDPASLADALRRLILDGDLRRTLARAAAERIRREFSLQSAAARLAEIYDEHLSRLH